MKKSTLSFLLGFLILLSCQTPDKEHKIPVYAWTTGPAELTNEALISQFIDLKEKGIDGLMYNGGQDPATYKRVGKLVRDAGMEFHAWIPAMVQKKTPKIQAEWYGVNGKGENALEKPAYVDYYKFLCPNHEGVYDFLAGMYTAVAEVDEVDGIHLDYIRFPDVILAKGLWEKYGLVMDREYPEYDYCYGTKCVADFKALTGIDITTVDDPSQVESWKQFRYDLITKLVNRLSDQIHQTGKAITAAVFPGPNSIAKRIVRQEWDKWNIDALYPMHYNDFYLEGPEWIANVTKEGVEATDGKVPLYSGLFICPKPEKREVEKDPENHGLLPEEIGIAIRASMENGATGICLFTPDRMTDTHWKAFREAVHFLYEVRQ
ncbi:MAG: hypothetical protein OEQ53_02675 [Saprospiraceae bacterium]|nr:hypothetical protein [Saprospiraceae bacterium]